MKPAAAVEVPLPESPLGGPQLTRFGMLKASDAELQAHLFPYGEGARNARVDINRPGRLQVIHANVSIRPGRGWIRERGLVEIAIRPLIGQVSTCRDEIGPLIGRLSVSE